MNSDIADVGNSLAVQDPFIPNLDQPRWEVTEIVRQIAIAIDVGNSLAVQDPFIPNLDQPRWEVAEIVRQIAMDSSVASPGVCFGIEMIRSMLRESALAAFNWLAPSWLVDVQSVESLEDDAARQRAEHETAILVLRLWRANESGLDEETRLIVERATEEGFFDDPNPTLSAETQAAVLARRRAKNQAVLRLIDKWVADESGYDEEVWPIVKKAIEENRTSYRKRFSD